MIEKEQLLARSLGTTNPREEEAVRIKDPDE